MKDKKDQTVKKPSNDNSLGEDILFEEIPDPVFPHPVKEDDEAAGYTPFVNDYDDYIRLHSKEKK